MRRAAAVLTVVGGASVALGQSVKLDVGAFLLEPDTNMVFEFDVPNNFQALEFHFQGDYIDDGPDGAWGSDLAMVLTAPDGDSVQIGGFSPVPGPSDLPWDFDGDASDADGFYESGPHAGWIDSPSSGMWTVEMWADSFGPAQWENVSVTITGIPAPGATALLALGGLAAIRRRR